MKVIVEKREVVGTLKTLVGTYHLLNDKAARFDERWRFQVIDEEGFENWIQVHGDFVTVPISVPIMLDVRRIVSNEEVAQNSALQNQLSVVE